MIISKDSQAVIFRKNTNGIKFLLLKRYDPEQDRVDYRLVKGGIEEGENSEETIIREIKEETGLQNLILKKSLGEYSYQAGNVLHKIDAFLVENTEKDKIKVDSTYEGGFTIESANWFSGKEAEKLLYFDREKDLIRKAVEEIVF